MIENILYLYITVATGYNKNGIIRMPSNMTWKLKEKEYINHNHIFWFCCLIFL